MAQTRFNSSNQFLEKTLWEAADKMRSNMDAAEYKHVVLGLIFLKYISDSFLELHSKLQNDPEGLSDPEDVDEYKMRNVFWVPSEARWNYLQNNAKKPEIGKFIDAAMESIEKDNRSLKGVLPKNYARPSLDKQRLGELIDLIGTIGLGYEESKAQDVLGRVYEYFLGQFADAEGKKGGQFYTPRCIVNLLVGMIEPFKGRVFDPCCGSGGMFVQSQKFIEVHGGRLDDVHVLGQESNQTTWRLCKMNLALRGIESKSIIWNNEGSFLNDAHKDLKADFILANPPFNDSDWSGQLLREDIRWKFGIPPARNANFAWIQHFIHHLSPKGIAGFVLSNGSMSSKTSGEGEIRKNIIEAGIIECMIALPSKLFYNTSIPACLWFISREKHKKFRHRNGSVLFIDARKMGEMVDRRHRLLMDVDINKIVDTYHTWKREDGTYENIPGFCKSTTLDEIRKQNHILTPGRYVGFEEEEDDGIPFDKKIEKITTELSELFQKSRTLEKEIKENLKEIGFVI